MAQPRIRLGSADVWLAGLDRWGQLAGHRRWELLPDG